MSARLDELLHDRRIAHDVRVAGDFARIYCDGHHVDAERTPLLSPGVEAGCYGSTPPVVCAECADMQVYAEKRRAFCHLDPKPYCSECPEHCYKPDRAEQMRTVMRYAGPRSFHIHPVEGMKHAMAMRRSKKAARDAAATE